jgi:hypothetical protein
MKRQVAALLMLFACSYAQCMDEEKKDQARRILADYLSEDTKKSGSCWIAGGIFYNYLQNVQVDIALSGKATLIDDNKKYLIDIYKREVLEIKEGSYSAPKS